MNSKAAEKLKTWLLGGDPAAKEEYLAFRARGGGKLAGGCRLLGRKLRGRPPQGKLLYSGGPESSLSRRESPEQLAARLAAYAVVTFDVFDTLLLRPLARPEDAFYLLGARLGVPRSPAAAHPGGRGGPPPEGAGHWQPGGHPGGDLGCPGPGDRPVPGGGHGRGA